MLVLATVVWGLSFPLVKNWMNAAREHDFPGGEWRRVQRAEGYRAVVLNGEITFEDGRETGALSGRLLRHGQ